MQEKWYLLIIVFFAALLVAFLLSKAASLLAERRRNKNDHAADNDGDEAGAEIFGKSALREASIRNLLRPIFLLPFLLLFYKRPLLMVAAALGFLISSHVRIFNAIKKRKRLKAVFDAEDRSSVEGIEADHK